MTEAEYPWALFIILQIPPWHHTSVCNKATHQNQRIPCLRVINCIEHYFGWNGQVYPLTSLFLARLSEIYFRHIKTDVSALSKFEAFIAYGYGVEVIVEFQVECVSQSACILL